MKLDKFPVVFVGTFGHWVFNSEFECGKYYGCSGNVEKSSYTFSYLNLKDYPTISIEEFTLIKLEEE